MIPKFRAWDKTDKEMYLVDEINFNRGEFESIGDGITFLRGADKVELMQSTGLLDAFGTEIFEGDIVTKNQGETFGVVRYGICRSSLCFYVEQNYKGSELTFPINTNFSRYYKVVGNIYENPELLEAKE
mgnify:CR=1 FL=1